MAFKLEDYENEIDELFVVRVKDDPEFNNVPRDGFYGDEPVLYWSREDAECRARELATTGDWPYGAPEYVVVSVRDVDDLDLAELRDLEADDIA